MLIKAIANLLVIMAKSVVLRYSAGVILPYNILLGVNGEASPIGIIAARKRVQCLKVNLARGFAAMNVPSEGFTVLYVWIRGIDVVLQRNAYLRRQAHRLHCTKGQGLSASSSVSKLTLACRSTSYRLQYKDRNHSGERPYSKLPCYALSSLWSMTTFWLCSPSIHLCIQASHVNRLHREELFGRGFHQSSE
jgi:hypothetical protein